MPSQKKRIGYLPSPYVQELIIEIANKENISQSKVVGILVEEALSERGFFDPLKSIELKKKKQYRNKVNLENASLNFNDMDELISDKGITYNRKEHKMQSSYQEDISSKFNEEYNEDLLKQFKQFLLFQKMLEEEE